MAKSYQSLVAFVLLAVSLAVYAHSAATLSAEYRYQILDLVSAYSYKYDGKDLEGYLALYTKDCVWEAYASGVSTPMVRAADRDELRTVTTQRLAMLRERGIQSRHYQTNTILVRREDGQVEGTTLLNLVWQVPGEKPYTVMTGIYRDLFVKSEGGWRFAKRTLLMDQSEMR